MSQHKAEGRGRGWRKEEKQVVLSLFRDCKTATVLFWKSSQANGPG